MPSSSFLHIHVCCTTLAELARDELHLSGSFMWLWLWLWQAMMAERLMFLAELQATVLEVKVVEGLGTTVDIVLVNGVLREGETIVLCGLQGPIVTTIRSLLTPHPLKVCPLGATCWASRTCWQKHDPSQHPGLMPDVAIMSCLARCDFVAVASVIG